MREILSFLRYTKNFEVFFFVFVIVSLSCVFGWITNDEQMGIEMKWGDKFYQSRVFVFEERLCVLLRLGWFCLFESRVRVSSKLRLLGIF